MAEIRVLGNGSALQTSLNSMKNGEHKKERKNKKQNNGVRLQRRGGRA